ncbi:hypothetical protein D9M68_420690 [compost metagenome]
MRSLRDLADIEAAIWVTCRSGRSPLRATTQPSPALTRALMISPMVNQRCKASKKAMWWVTSSTNNRVNGAARPGTLSSAVKPRYMNS